MLTGKERGTLSIGKKFKSGDRQNPNYNAIKQHFETCEKYTQEMEAVRKIKFTGYDHQDLVFIETKTGLRLSVQQVQRL
jgi:hypothetical protein